MHVTSSVKESAILMRLSESARQGRYWVFDLYFGSQQLGSLYNTRLTNFTPPLQILEMDTRRFKDAQ